MDRSVVPHDPERLHRVGEGRDRFHARLPKSSPVREGLPLVVLLLGVAQPYLDRLISVVGRSSRSSVGEGRGEQGDQPDPPQVTVGGNGSALANEGRQARGETAIRDRARSHRRAQRGGSAGAPAPVPDNAPVVPAISTLGLPCPRRRHASPPTWHTTVHARDRNTATLRKSAPNAASTSARTNSSHAALAVLSVRNYLHWSFVFATLLVLQKTRQTGRTSAPKEKT